MSDVLALAKELIARRSVTPEDAECQKLIGERLAALGFELETMVFEDTTNLWARKGSAEPVFCFAGHTDVVPSGPETKWTFPPFEPTEHNGMLFGRGAADMKGSLAAMVIAAERFVAQHPNHQGSIAFLLTSDEEGPFINGTTRVIDTLEARNEKITWCIVGEPSSTAFVGDVVKHGRRGSLTGDLVVHGTQGHVAYPHLAHNAVHAVAPALTILTEIQWDEGNDDFPPTSFQVSNINAGTGAGNVIPGECHICFNFRYSTEVTADVLTQSVTDILDQQGLDYSIEWTYNGLPFLTERGELVNAVEAVIHANTGTTPTFSTAGGTSDGRFIAPTGAQVIELGPVNASIHKVDEHVKIADLDRLAEFYEGVLVELLLP
ncbi:succinyl-diaminopimelate desuccinylase [Alteromonas flava]|uniref:succinyl-diaminopimelate desuccinylase n=1 Tax=Alteromonas flava TaxID=2048003 RepID=UPI000C289AAA|nr:succinyl-diaminopimelate desuccinylase [Alteromonas flava]